MHVVKALDAGDIILQAETAISPEDTGGSVHDRLAEMTPETLTKALHKITKGADTRTPQDDALSSYAPKLLRDHGKLDCTKSATELERLIRAYHPWPSTYTTFTDKKGKVRRLKVFPPTSVISASDTVVGELNVIEGKLCLGCGSNTALKFHQVQAEGSKAMSAEDFLKGNPIG